MLDTIVAGTDLSPACERVVEWLPALKSCGLKEVVLAHAAQCNDSLSMGCILKDIVEPALAAEAERLRRAGLQVTTDLRVGSPAVILADIAETTKAAAIVVGSHGRSRLARVLLGSVAGELLHQTTRPVLIARIGRSGPAGRPCALPQQPLFARTLFPTDFSPPAARAFNSLRGLAPAGSAIVLLHVQDRVQLRHAAERLQEFNQIDQARLDDMGESLKAHGLSDVETNIVYGVPTHEIIKAAGEGRHTVIFMSTRGRGALAEVAVGSVAMNVARLAPVPVFFIPPAA